MLNGPPLTANNAGQFAIDQAPPDSDNKYANNFGPAQALAPKVQHKWYEVFEIGVESRTGSNQVSYAAPLTAGTIMRLHADSVPDFWQISTIVNVANTQLKVWVSADPAGPAIRLGNGGDCCIPSKGNPFLCLQAIAGSVYGTVLALGGFNAQDVYVNGGNQT
jgi:hypothetical protein